jgi:hypothetical protein
MICYFIKNGRIAAVEEFPGLSAEEALERGQSIFEQNSEGYDGFEVRDGNRRICRVGRLSRKKETPSLKALASARHGTPRQNQQSVFGSPPSNVSARA